MNYNNKAKDSFKTKWNLFCFAHVIDIEKIIKIEAFRDFKINDDLIKLYTTRYHQYYYDDPTDENIVPTVREISDKLKELDKSELKEKFQADYVDQFEEVFPEQDFNQIASAEQCYYCELKEEDFEKLYDHHKIYKKAARGWKLEMDRKSANYEYTKDNCVMACYWCNNAKTDEFDAKEFKPIGLEIGKVMMDRLIKRRYASHKLSG